MKFVDEEKIAGLLSGEKNVSYDDIAPILAKSAALKRLSLEETALLMRAESQDCTDAIFKAALDVKNRIYGKRIVLFAPLYISNRCSNNCLYCGFRTANKDLRRISLSPDEIEHQTEFLLSQGHMRVLMVAGESTPGEQKAVEYFLDSIKAIYRASFNGKNMKRVNVNLPSMTVEDLKKIRDAGVGTYQLFQETYHEETYKRMHVSGPKKDMLYRLEAFDRAFEAGLDDIGMGVLYGLYDWKFETLAMLSHVEYLEGKYGIGPHTISVPRLQEAPGSEIASNIPHPVSECDMRRLVAILRLAVPYTGIILSTRESRRQRDELISLGVSQISAGSSVTPGGYGEDESANQFELSDNRNLEEIVASLIKHGYIPSFCAACYRKSRTGDAFMQIAKPGNIKSMCTVNALSTLKEYINDYANDTIKKDGGRIIEEHIKNMPEKDAEILCEMLLEIEKGKRDVYR